MITLIKLNGTVLRCREHDDGNFWIVEDRKNWDTLFPNEAGRPITARAIFGSCIVGPNGSVREARENSISFWSIEGGADIQYIGQELESHEITENVRKWIARKTYRRMMRMNPVLTSA